MQERVENIIRRVAQEFNVPEYVAKAMVESQFQCAREELKKGESGKPDTFRNVRFRHLGLVVAKSGKINKIHAAKIAKQK